VSLLKSKRQLIYLGICFTLLIGGCQHNKKKIISKEEKNIYRDIFTKEEKTTGTAEFNLTENVKIDAQVTPIDKYKNGLKKFYMKHYFETKDLNDINEFMKKPTLFGKDLSVIMSMLSEKLSGKFYKKPRFDAYDNKAKEIIARSTFQDKNGNLYTFNTSWGTGDDRYGYDKGVYCPIMYIRLEEKSKAMSTQIEHKILQYLKDFKNMEVSFIKDKRQTGEELKDYLEKLLGRDLSDTWDCIPVTEESIVALNNVYQTDITHLESKQEYCSYRYYYDVKGFPYTESYLSYQLKEGETASKLARMSTPNNTLIGLCNPSIMCHLSKEGIIALDINNIRMEGDVYKEAEQVVDSNAILNKIKIFYEKQILIRPVTVTEVNIVYTGYFTDGNEGEIQPTVAPFWRVKVYNNDSNGSQFFFYDAFTGEAIVEGITAME